MNKQTFRIIFSVFVIIHLFFFWQYNKSAPKSLQVTFLDVGQGDACVLKTPSGKVVIMDTGTISEDQSEDAGRNVILPFLHSRGISQIDTIILSHPHADHIGGAKTLLEKTFVRRLMDNGEAKTENPVVTKLVASAQAHQVNYVHAMRGQVLDFGDGVRIRILAPNATLLQGDTNNASVVARVEYGNTAFLFTGDAEVGEEQFLLKNKHELVCDVLKVGHHGSKTSSSDEFIQAAHPRIAMISVGKHNLYGHPNLEVLQRFQFHGISVYRTDQHGAITCISNGQQVSVKTTL